MPTLGWRYLLGFTTLPLLICLVFCFYLPESARYYLTVGEEQNALNVLTDMARINKGTLPEGTLISKKKVNLIHVITNRYFSGLISRFCDSVRDK